MCKTTDLYKTMLEQVDLPNNVNNVDTYVGINYEILRMIHMIFTFKEWTHPPGWHRAEARELAICNLHVKQRTSSPLKSGLILQAGMGLRLENWPYATSM